jgi:hypothetical protein
MSQSHSEEAHYEEIRPKLSVIRSYLETKFPNHEIREGTDPSGMDYVFSVHTLNVIYKLQLATPIGDRALTAEGIRSLLVLDEVARRMREAHGEVFRWQPGLGRASGTSDAGRPPADMPAKDTR